MTTQTERDLVEARAALHALNIGRAKASFSVNGRQTTYVQANKGDLESYVQRLEAEIGTTKRRRPFGVSF